MTLISRRIRGEYTNHNPNDINDFRQDQLDECIAKDVSGYFVLGEGEAWILLQGIEKDVQAVVDSIDNSNFLTNWVNQRTVHISNRDLDDVYLYYEDNTPMSSV